MIRIVTMRALLAVAVLYCTTSFQGYRVCQGPDGYNWTEWQWQGLIIGSDSDGARWTSSRWRDGEITTVTPPR